MIDFDLATSELSDNAFRVVVYLLMHANKDGDCWPSLAKIAIETRRSERSLDFAIRELKSKNLLESFNEGRGKYRFCVKPLTSATGCAGKGDERAQKTTGTSATGCARKELTSAKSEVNERKICTEQAQKVNPPPTTPLICELDYELDYEQGAPVGREILPIGQPKRHEPSDVANTALAHWLMGEETKFKPIAQANPEWTTEFILWAIEAAQKQGIRSSAYLAKVCRNNWKDGWESRETSQNKADEAERARVKKRRDALT
jgi:hypothetical protein